jgi:hypothetical protein
MIATPSHLTALTAFALGVEAIVGLVLGLSDGLSEVHKSVLVGFVVVFPLLSLGLLLLQGARSQTVYYEPAPEDQPA